ncbi:MAG: hypothetical protein ACE5KM_00545 [Planctomycetaceae bacterium]
MSTDRYSKLADFELVVAGQSYPVAQVARDFILLDSPTAIPPGPAALLIRVEGEEEIRREIEVLPGSDGESRRVAIRRS